MSRYGRHVPIVGTPGFTSPRVGGAEGHVPTMVGTY
jgi:hypothetical protein